MDFTAALPALVITLREGFEATLVVGIVLACLSKAGRSTLNPWVYGGAIAGVVASVGLGLILGWQVQQLGETQRILGFTVAKETVPLIQEILAGSLTLGAIGLLSWMLFWMTKQAASLKTEVQTAVTATLANDGAGWGVFGLAFLAVTREGFETVLFLLTQVDLGLAPVLGAIGGFLGAIVLGVLLFWGGIKINIRQFFQVMGLGLLLIVGGLVVSSLHAFDLAAAILSQINPTYANLCLSQDSCILGREIWNFSSFLPDKQFPGLLLKSLLGYRDHLYLLQFISYILFLGSAATIYLTALKDQTTLPSQKPS